MPDRLTFSNISGKTERRITVSNNQRPSNSVADLDLVRSRPFG
jgi:hypothetical protein